MLQQRADAEAALHQQQSQHAALLADAHARIEGTAAQAQAKLDRMQAASEALAQAAGQFTVCIHMKMACWCCTAYTCMQCFCYACVTVIAHDRLL